MSKESDAGMVAVAIVAVLIGVPSCAGCHTLGMSDVRAQAIERGLGEYRVDQKTQKVEFHWNVKAGANSVEIERSHPAASIVDDKK